MVPGGHGWNRRTGYLPLDLAFQQRVHHLYGGAGTWESVRGVALRRVRVSVLRCVTRGHHLTSRGGLGSPSICTRYRITVTSLCVNGLVAFTGVVRTEHHLTAHRTTAAPWYAGPEDGRWWVCRRSNLRACPGTAPHVVQQAADDRNGQDQDYQHRQSPSSAAPCSSMLPRE